jgi:DNA polymerase I-like protein with 3'-5' exonuclease and polymerase domains
MLNVLIQGSAADCTKQAVIDYYKVKGKDDRLLLTVHDEILAMCPKKTMKKSMQVLKDCMEAVEFEVPMLSEGTYSDKDWVNTKTYDAKGKVQYNGR